MDPRIDKYADIIVNYSTEIKAGDLVALFTVPEALPLALALYEKILENGARPIFAMVPNEAQEIMLKVAPENILTAPDPMQQWLMENADVRLSVRAVTNSRALTNIDPARIQMASKGRGPIMKTFMERQSSGELRWCVTIYPTNAAAQDAEMSLREYEDFVFGAAKVDQPDPVTLWQAMAERQQKLVDYLAGKQQIEVKGENIDLTLSIEGRTFINADGKKNFPDGEIFTGPVEDSVNGTVRFTYPAIYGGREVDGVELAFEEGKVVKATASKGEAYLNSVLDTDEGARYLGEFAIGTNDSIQQFTRSILFDEKIGGTVHMAVGASYPDTGGVNQSDVHWDMICDMRSGGQIIVDGELFYENGTFKV